MSRRAKPRVPPELVIAARNDAYDTQAEAARRIDAHPETWGDWERGRRAMPRNLYLLYRVMTMNKEAVRPFLEELH